MAKKYIGKSIIVGIDEVGRGPLAGPLTVAACAYDMQILQRPHFLAGIRDSKKLTPRSRLLWYKKLRDEKKIVYACVSISHTMIDARGISYAARIAVKRCLERLLKENSWKGTELQVLLDGGLYAPLGYDQRTIIKGDEKEPIIAAASIIAKVTRDRYMVRIHSKFPAYEFAMHKGYGTHVHIAAIKRHGLSSIHRKTFCTRIV